MSNGAFLGRAIKLEPNNAEDAPVLGVRSKTVNLLGEALDTTSDDDDSFQRFLEEAARKGISMTFEGIAKGGFLRRVAEGGNVVVLEDYSLYVPGVGVWSGDWIVSGVSFTGETDGIATFSATVNSNGPLEFTAEPEDTAS